MVGIPLTSLILPIQDDRDPINWFNQNLDFHQHFFILFLCLGKWSIVVERQVRNLSAKSWQKQVTFWYNDDDVHFVLHQQSLIELL
jgi:hypothetical protein